MDWMDPAGGVNRRRFLSTIAAGTVGSVAATGAASACGKSDRTFHLFQNGEHYEIRPMKGPKSAAEFYDWDKARTNYSSQGTTAYQEPDTSILFLYEGPDGDVHLICVHGELDGSGNGGSVTFDFIGLAHQGSWIVGDDRYQGPANYDQWETDGLWQRVDWTWASSRTDGGVYGPINGDPYVKIVPSFNEEATLHGEYYDGEVTDWQVLSGDCDHPTSHTLDMDEPVCLLYNPFENKDAEDLLEEKREWWDDIEDDEKDENHWWHDDDDEKDEADDHDDSWWDDDDDEKDEHDETDDHDDSWWDDDDDEKDEHDGTDDHDDSWWDDDDDDTDEDSNGPWWADG